MMTLEALIRRIYDTTDFLSVMQLTKDGDRKRANLHLLLQYAKQYEENTDAAHNGVSGFLRYIDWLLDSGNDFQQTSLTAGVENAVAVKTMHRSKGLEYPFVFLGKLESPFPPRTAGKMRCSPKRDWSGSASRTRKITPVQRPCLLLSWNRRTETLPGARNCGCSMLP